MTATIRSELYKLRSTRSLWAILAAGLFLADAGALVLVSAGRSEEMATRLSGFIPLRFGPTNLGLLVALFGIRCFADETQHHTLASTLLRTPKRALVLASKALVAGGTALVFCMLVDTMVVPIAVIGMTSRHLPFTYDFAATAALTARVAGATILLTLLGVAAGAAIRNRSVAMVGAVLWFSLGEGLIGGVLHISRFLPGVAMRGLVASDGATEHFGAALSGLVLISCVVTAGAAALLALRRDVA